MNIVNKVRKSGYFVGKIITKKIFSSFSKIETAKNEWFLCILYKRVFWHSPGDRTPEKVPEIERILTDARKNRYSSVRLSEALRAVFLYGTM